MEYSKVPEIAKIGGKEAIESLNEYINALELQASNDLTEKQKTTIIKFARGLITSIEDEMQKKPAPKQTEKPHIMQQIKDAILKGIAKPDFESEEKEPT